MRLGWFGDRIPKDFREGRTSEAEVDADVDVAVEKAAKLLAPLFDLAGVRGKELEEQLAEAKADYARFVKTGLLEEEEGAGEEGRGKEPSTSPATSAARSSSEASSSSSSDPNSERKSLLGSLVNRGYRDGVISDSSVETAQRVMDETARTLTPLLGIKEGGEESEKDLVQARADYARVVKTGFSPGEGEGGKGKEGKEKEDKGVIEKTEAAAAAAAATTTSVSAAAKGASEAPEPTRVARAARWPAADGPLRSLRVPALVALEASGLAALTLLTHSLLASTVAHAIGLFALCALEKSDDDRRGRSKGGKRSNSNEVVLR